LSKERCSEGGSGPLEILENIVVEKLLVLWGNMRQSDAACRQPAVFIDYPSGTGDHAIGPWQLKLESNAPLLVFGLKEAMNENPVAAEIRRPRQERAPFDVFVEEDIDGDAEVDALIV